MKPEAIYSRRLLGLDTNVWIVTLGCILFSIGLFSFKIFKKADTSNCMPPQMMISSVATGNNSIFYTDELLSFKANVNVDDNVIWDFGDGSEKEIGYLNTHKYAKADEYLVKVIVNGKCEQEKSIKVLTKTIINEVSDNNTEETSVSSSGSIKGAASVVVGDPHEYSTSVSAKSYLWRVKNEPYYKEQTTPTATFTFRSKGVYTIELILDNDHTKISKVIQVSDVSRPTDDIKNQLERLKKINNITDAEAAARKAKENQAAQNIQNNNAANQSNTPTEAEKITTPEKPKIKKVGPGNFKLKLEQLMRNEIQASDLYQYLAFGGQTNVLINENTRISFDEFCKQLAGQYDKMRIKEVSFAPDENGNIVTIKVSREVKKKIGPVGIWKEG